MGETYNETKTEGDVLAPVQSQAAGEVHIDTAYTHDAVFGEITSKGPNYRNVSSMSRSMGVEVEVLIISVRWDGWAPLP